MNRDASENLTRLSRFVDDHKAEADFTFAVRNPVEQLDPRVFLRRGYPDDPTAAVEVRRLSQILFRRDYDEKRPKYALDNQAMATVTR